MSWNWMKGVGATDADDNKTSSKRKRKSLTSVINKFKEFKYTISTPWTEKYLPSNLDELFVHKKKVEEVKLWLENYHRVSKICVITGPSGCGKTATVCLLAKELGFQLKEWINPLDVVEFQKDRSNFDIDDIRGKSQVDLFSEFIMRASSYPTLPIKGLKATAHKNLILVEDFPNKFFKDNKLFHQILINYHKNNFTRSPIVFILADCNSADANAYKLFPKELLTELPMKYIEFNKLTGPMITKFLTIICSKEGITFNRNDLDDISFTSDGDIRNAVNTLQFKVQPNSFLKTNYKLAFKMPKGKGGRNAKKDGKVLDSAHSKDEDLVLFRALGKVLYAKRMDPVNSDANSAENKLKGKLEKEKRLRPLIEIPDEIGSKVQISTQKFFDFLSQNYLPHFTVIDDVSRVATYLADAELLISKFIEDGDSNKGFKNSNMREEISMSIVNRGIMHSNTIRAPQTFRPISKPLENEQNSIIIRMNRARDVFPEYRGLDRELLMDLTILPAQPYLPFLPDQLDLLREINSFKGKHYRK